jgi:hypothetical protein
VNPYVSASLAMCVIVIIALAATAYMAVFFNRRAKADLAAALLPMREVVAGSANVEEASVDGRYAGHLAEGRVAQLAGGMGRVFYASIIDGAGGERWVWTVSRARQAGEADTFDYEGPHDELQTKLLPAVASLARESSLVGSWLKVEYDPAPGYIRLTRPMRTRRDMPLETSFRSYLESLVSIAATNRAVQNPES